jgi:hypothetical protein
VVGVRFFELSFELHRLEESFFEKIDLVCPLLSIAGISHAVEKLTIKFITKK